MTIAELQASILVTGDRSSPHWDATWRSQLVANLGILAGHLARVGITDVYADGSFCSNKDRPGDIDGYFVTDWPQWVRQSKELMAMDAAWDLGRRIPDPQGRPKPLMWHEYKVELFPVFRRPFARHSARGGDPPVTIDAFFRESRDGRGRGIVKVLPEGGNHDPKRERVPAHPPADR